MTVWVNSKTVFGQFKTVMKNFQTISRSSKTIPRKSWSALINLFGNNTLIFRSWNTDSNVSTKIPSPAFVLWLLYFRQRGSGRWKMFEKFQWKHFLTTMKTTPYWDRSGQGCQGHNYPTSDTTSKRPPDNKTTECAQRHHNNTKYRTNTSTPPKAWRWETMKMVRNYWRQNFSKGSPEMRANGS